MSTGQQTVSFVNPGEIDVRLVTTMGVNVKEGESPIGYFGTGLKYAIAVLLREGQEVRLWSGAREFSFATEPATIRGKDFQFVLMLEPGAPLQRLGFTTELGKNWTIENAYRELYSNCLDEQGRVEEGAETPSEGQTVIAINGEKFWDCHLRRWEFLLNPGRQALAIITQREPGTPAIEGQVVPLMEVYAGESNRVFYRGIAAFRSDRPFQFTYNLLTEQKLSEDRQLNGWDIDDRLAEYLSKCKAPEVLEKAFGSKGAYEAQNHHLAYTNGASEEFCQLIERLMKERPLELTDPVKAAYIRHRPQPEKGRRVLEPTLAQTKAIGEAKAELTDMGFQVGYQINISDELGRDILGQALDGVIWLAPRVFEGHDELVLTLLEEFIHLRNRVSDCTREMQNVLFREIIRLGRGLPGAEPKAEAQPADA